MIPPLPNPCPTLREGKFIGAQEHSGFVRTFNWLINILRNIKEYLPTEVNGRTGNISIVAGDGVEVVTSGNTITVGLGAGSRDSDNPDNEEENGGGNQENDPNWNNEEPSETSGADFGSGGGMFRWYPETREIGVGGVMIGRRFIPCTSGMGPGLADNTYQLKVTLSAGGAGSCQVVADSTIGKQPTSTECWIPIYTIADGIVTADYRGAFVVPVWE